MQTCPNCSYENRPGVVFCENCGTSLIGSSAGVDTRMIDENEAAASPPKAAAVRASDSVSKPPTPPLVPEGAEPAEAGSTEFPEDGLLRLEVSETTSPIIMMVEKSVTFGRLDAATGSMPDIDLTPFAGYRAGVSRRHAEIRLDKDTRTLNIWDLGSSNGTFLNGDRLMSHRAYGIKDGDNIRFGQLDVTVRFERRVGEATKSPGDASAKD